MGKLVWVPVTSPCKTFIPCDGLVCPNWPFSPPKRATLRITLFTYESFVWLAHMGEQRVISPTKWYMGKELLVCLTKWYIHICLQMTLAPCWLIHQRFSTTQQTYCCTHYYCKLVLGFRVHPSPPLILPKWIFCTFWWIIKLRTVLLSGSSGSHMTFMCQSVVNLLHHWQNNKVNWPSHLS
jgi:hypothetical protein